MDDISLLHGTHLSLESMLSCHQWGPGHLGKILFWKLMFRNLKICLVKMMFHQWMVHQWMAKYASLAHHSLYWLLWNKICDFDGLVQERRNSTANALELRLSCTNPSICSLSVHTKLPTHGVCSLNDIIQMKNIVWRPIPVPRSCSWQGPLYLDDTRPRLGH